MMNLVVFIEETAAFEVTTVPLASLIIHTKLCKSTSPVEQMDAKRNPAIEYAQKHRI